MFDTVLIWYIVAPVASVLCTLVLARLVRNFFSPFYGSIDIEPSEGVATVAERLSALIRMWLVYFVTIAVFTLTSGSFSYGVLIIRIASSEFTLDGAKAVFLANSILIRETLLAGLLVGIVVVVIARLMTVSYSDFLLRYLIFQLLVPLNILLISIPMVLSGPGQQFYAAISDYGLREVFPDLPVLVLISATVASITTEITIWLMHRFFPSTGRGSYPLISAFLDSLVEGEYTISDSNVTELYTSAIAETINGHPEGKGLQSIKWFSFSGTEEIARCIRTEVRAWIASKNYGIPINLVRQYDELMCEKAKGIQKLAKTRPNVDRDIMSLTEKIARYAKLPEGIRDVRVLIDDSLEWEAQTKIRECVKVITREMTASRLDQILHARLRVGDVIGSRRFMVLNEERLVLTYPAPQVGSAGKGYASNAGILIPESPYIVNGYSDFFSNWWDKLGKLEEFRTGIEPLFRTNLKLKRGERVLITVDNVKPHLVWMGRIAADLARTMTDPQLVKVVCYPSTGSAGIEPPPEVWEAAFGQPSVSELRQKLILDKLLDKRELTEDEKECISSVISANRTDVVEVVLSLSWFSISHTSFRGIMCTCGGTRFASMPRLTPSVLLRCKDADYTVIEPRTREVANWLTRAASARLTAPNGTELTFNLKGRRARADTGLIDSPGMVGNIPGGEAYIAPVEESVSGVLVFDCAPNRRLPTPMQLTIKAGKVTKVRGDKKYRAFLLRRFKEHPSTRQVAELGLGTNNKATDSINIREAEKILGTVHIGLGDNSGFGGKSQAPFHEDFVVFRPTLVLTMETDETKCLIEEGELRL